jgi:hypothetical protein
MATPDAPGVSINYQALVEMLPSWMERKDDAFKAQIPRFINLAENRIATDMKQEGFQAVVTSVLDVSNIQPKPVFWRETISFTIKIGNKWVDLKLRSLEYIKRFWPEILRTGIPAYYADYNFQHFYVAPTPAEPIEFELVYYARLEPLNDTHQENWITLNAPQTLFFATMLEATMWCKNPAAEQKWMQQYQIAVGGIVAEDGDRKEDRNVRVK